jgi:hypothetical protein
LYWQQRTTMQRWICAKPLVWLLIHGKM